MSHPIITDQVYFVNRASRGRSQRASERASERDSNTNIRLDLNANTEARRLAGAAGLAGALGRITRFFIYTESTKTP